MSIAETQQVGKQLAKAYRKALRSGERSDFMDFAEATYCALMHHDPSQHSDLTIQSYGASADSRVRFTGEVFIPSDDRRHLKMQTHVLTEDDDGLIKELAHQSNSYQSMWPMGLDYSTYIDVLAVRNSLGYIRSIWFILPTPDNGFLGLRADTARGEAETFFTDLVNSSNAYTASGIYSELNSFFRARVQELEHVS